MGFSLDDKGRPLFAFSSMSSHTGDLAADSRVSLTVMSATFEVTLTRPVDNPEFTIICCVYR